MPSIWLRRAKIVHWFDHLHLFDPQHSVRGKAWTRTYLGLETHFPTVKCRRIKEFVEMHFWDLIPQLFNHAILRISSFCMRGMTTNRKCHWKSRCWWSKIPRVSLQFFCSLRKSPWIPRHGLALCLCRTSRNSKESCWRFTWCKLVFKNVSWNAKWVPCLKLREFTLSCCSRIWTRNWFTAK